MRGITTIRSTFLLLIALTASFCATAAAQDADTDWPREIDTPQSKIVIYQPQLESFDDVTLKARAAVSVTQTGKEPVFGATWFESLVRSDRETGVVTLDNVRVTHVKFPNASADQLAEFKRIVETEVPRWNLKLSRDQLVADMAAINTRAATDNQINTAPPEIIFATSPTVLVTIDGDPLLNTVEGTSLKSVVNTPFFIVQDPSSGLCYLRGKEVWYSARDVKGPWATMTKTPPRAVVDLGAKMVSEAPPEDAAADSTGSGPATPVVPGVIVRTQPAALIQTDGEPEFAPVEGTSLLYLKNSEDDVIMDIATQDYYVLVAGRWYASKSLASGPWRFVPGSKLPADFPQIPADSDVGDVRANVPGTTEAEEAVMDNQVPQTATVSRKDATLEVAYDGDPKFERISGTTMSYAVNTDKSVLSIDGRYYCCDQAVWFESKGAKGPWVVCTSVPKSVEHIPPESPVYNVKYVYIYDSTPDVVYVGYTPAYYGSYVYGGCVVYGTGYYYHPWYGHYYYPRPVTYGFGVCYSPYAGWGFSYGVSYGWFTIRVSTYGGYWGAGGYHYGYNHGYAHGYHHGYHHGYQHGYNNGWAAGYRAGQNAGRPPQPYKRNAYQTRQSGVVSTRDQMAYKRPADGQRPTARPSTGKNNVYADRNGKVYRQTDQGWQKNTRQGWTPTDKSKAGSKPSTQPATKPAAKPAAKPATKPAARPATKPATRPAAKPAQKPAQAKKPASAPSKDLGHSAQSRQRAQQRSKSRPQHSGGKRR
jgi:hypothetical protein